MRWIIGVVVLLVGGVVPVAAGAPAQPEAQLTVIVRDMAGAPLRGVTVTLTYDGDAGQARDGEQTTDQDGRAVFSRLVYGIYIISFTGTTPDGRRILRPERQNLGLLADGAGTPGGFGLRVVTPRVTQLFVLGQLPGEPRAVPMFDLAPAPEVRPTPIAPLAELTKPTPTAVAFGLAPKAAPPRRSIHTLSTVERILVFVFLVTLALFSLLGILGRLRAQRQHGEDRHG